MIKKLIIGSIVLGTAIGVSKPTFASTNYSPSQFQDREMPKFNQYHRHGSI